MCANLMPKHHIALTSANDVREICQPLFDLLKLNYFSFSRIYSNEERVRLCTNSTVTENYYKDRWYECAAFERSPSLYYDGYFLWSHSTECKLDTFKKHLRESFKIQDIFSVIKTYENYMEVYDFATDNNGVNLGSVCFQQLGIFERFIQYFNIQASSLIHKAIKEKFKLPLEDGIFFSNDASGLQLDSKTKEFHKLTQPHQLSLVSEHGETLLSERETECLVNVIKGKTAKQIAQLLNISYRTVETHITNIKNKSGYNSINKLVEVALNSKSLVYFLQQVNKY